MFKSRIFWLLVILAALAVSVVATSCSLQISRQTKKTESSQANQATPSVEGLPPEFGRLQEVWDLLKREHYDREHMDPAKVSDGAIRGMLQALDDPYAAFLNSQQFSLESQDFKGVFEGIGAEVGVRDGRITVLSPLPDTPAEQAGIKPGDLILEINGESTKGMTLTETVSRIRGQKGTTVQLKVLHRNTTEPVSITVTRGVVKIQSVRFLMLTGGIGHLRISTFAETTNQQVQDALTKFDRAHGVGLVLDLRNNPGGLLSSVVDVASQFLDSGLVLYEIDAHGERTDWQVKPGGHGRTIPLVVLVNEFSASASEVLTGAIIDHNRAHVVGNKTFGKGSVNTLRPLKDGSGVYFTIARWFTPNGTLIEGKGITPDIEATNPSDATADVQLDRAIQVLQEQAAQRG